MVGPTIIHRKSVLTYELAMKFIAKKCKLQIKGEIFTKTDGQPVLTVACLNGL